MSQTEYTTVKIPASVWVARPFHIEDLDEVDSLRANMGSGRTFLKAVAYPWGVEFDVCEAEEET